VALHCRASGNPAPVITWTKEGSDDVIASGSPLKFSSVGRDHSGTYVCHADNKIGQPAMARRELAVTYAPEVTSQQTELNTGEGDSVELSCVVHANPAATVSWTKDGQALTSGTSAQVDSEDGGHRHSFVIESVSGADLGEYTCLAENNLGSGVQHITVTDKPGAPKLEMIEQLEDGKNFQVSWGSQSFYPISSISLKYKADDSEGPEKEIKFEEVEEMSSEDNYRTYKFTAELERNQDYTAHVILTNSADQSREATLQFSTKKEQTGQQNQTGGGAGLVAPLSSLLLALLLTC